MLEFHHLTPDQRKILGQLEAALPSHVYRELESAINGLTQSYYEAGYEQGRADEAAAPRTPATPEGAPNA